MSNRDFFVISAALLTILFIILALSESVVSEAKKIQCYEQALKTSMKKNEILELCNSNNK